MAGQKLSNNERIVLEALETGAQPMVAYEILAVMREGNPKVAPPTVYRALSKLMELGLVHRLESLNAFVACKHAEHHEDLAILSVCNDCGSVEESFSPDIVTGLASVVGKSGFAADRHVIEVHGRCASCTGAS